MKIMKQIKKTWILLIGIMLALGILSGCSALEDFSAVTDNSVTEAIHVVSDSSEAQELSEMSALAENSSESEIQSLDTSTEDDRTNEAADKADASGSTQEEEAAAREAESAALNPDGSYTSKDDVALYLHTYGELPVNFITKDEARSLGWSGGSLEPYAPGKCIGGDYFGNYEGVLPEGANYHECDIDTLGAGGRGAKRIVYDDAGNIYYSDDHYESFTQLY